MSPFHFRRIVSRISSIADFRVLRRIGIASLRAIPIVLFLCVALPQRALAQSFVDPLKHFNLQVQAGWTPKAFQSGESSGVTIQHGADGYIQIIVQDATDPAAYLESLSDGMGRLSSSYSVTDQGKRRLAGYASSYIIAGGLAPTGTRTTFVSVETFSAYGLTYAAVISLNGSSPSDPHLISLVNSARSIIQTLIVTESAPEAAVSAFTPLEQTSASGAAIASKPSPQAEQSTTAESEPPLSTEEKKKLAAMDVALKSGALTGAEYNSKRAAILNEARAQQERAAKLEAIEKAYKNGVLTKEEYEQKKRDLTATSVTAKH